LFAAKIVTFNMTLVSLMTLWLQDNTKHFLRFWAKALFTNISFFAIYYAGYILKETNAMKIDVLKILILLNIFGHMINLFKKIQFYLLNSEI